jgi:hypothetical protein
MKTFAVAILLVMGLGVIGCGSGSGNNSGNINGNWSATLTPNGGGNAVFAFTTSLVASGSNGTLTVSNFAFTTNDSSCTISSATETGSFVVSGNFNGQVTGNFNLTITSTNPSGVTLTLSGPVSGNSISGTWSLSGSASCTGSGTFTMTRV